MEITAKMIKELRDKTGAGMMDCKKALTETNGDFEKAIDWLREKGISQAAKRSERIAAEGLSVIKVDGNKAVILEVNSETDFVAKNEEFESFVHELADLLLSSDAKTMEEALLLSNGKETVKDLLTAKTAKIGEKLSFRRFEIITKNDDEVFGAYTHMGGKISAVVVLSGANEEVAKDIAMHVAALNPKYINETEITEEEIERERKFQTEIAINEGKPQEIAEKMVAGRLKKYFAEICLEEQAFVKDPNTTVGKYVSANGGKIIKFVRYAVGEGIEKRTENFLDEVMSQIKDK